MTNEYSKKRESDSKQQLIDNFLRVFCRILAKEIENSSSIL